MTERQLRRSGFASSSFFTKITSVIMTRVGNVCDERRSAMKKLIALVIGVLGLIGIGIAIYNRDN